MGAYSLSHLSDQTLRRDLATLVARDRATTAELLAHLAEVEERRLYAVTGHPSMQAYCVYELHLSEDSARKRIHAAHAARRVSAIYPALAEGRLHLSGVILLAPWLSQENSDELIGAATHKTKFEIEELIVARFPRLDAPSMVQAISASSRVTSSGQKCAPGRIDSSEGARRESSEPPPRIEPIAPERYVFQATIERRVHDKLRYAQKLLSHKIPSGDLAKILECALDAVIREQEKRQFAATDRPRHGNRATSENPRHTPAEVRRAVRERDQRQCTFVSEAGRRCSSRRQLEFDHIIPVARGGQATVENLRLRCRAHNQLAAEQEFGTEFMKNKRERARRAAAERHAKKADEHAAEWAGAAKALAETDARTEQIQQPGRKIG